MSPLPTGPGQQPGMPESVGFRALAFYVFSICSSVIDLTPGIRSIRPSLITAVVGLLMLGISGRMGELFKSRTAIAFVSLTVWFVLCVPFSVWPGGAVGTLVDQWLISFLTLFMVGGLIWNAEQCRKIAHLIAYSAIILAVISVAMNQRDPAEGRLMLQGSRWGNPNDLAMMLLTSLPFTCFMAIRRKNGVRRLIAIAGFPAILFAIAETASRAAMIGAGAAMLVLLFNVGFGQKVKLLVIGGVIVAVLLAALPARITGRFVTFFGDDTAPAGAIDRESATESAAARRMLLLDSITITMHYPVFGVGLGNFQIAQNVLARSRGEDMGNWHVTHNTYTQFSSESGVPGLLMFLTAVFCSFRAVSRVLKAPALTGSVAVQDLRMIAFALRISLIAFLTCAFFDSLAYSPTVAVLLGLSISLEYCTKNLQVPVVAPPAPSPRGPQMVRTWQRPPLQTAPPRRLPGRV